MRVTTGMVANSVGTNLNSLRRRLARVETELSTGKTVQTLGDGPSNAVEAMRITSNLRTLDQWEANMNDLSGWLDATEGALIHMTGSVQRMRDLAVAGATTTLDQGARDALALEVEAILEDLLATGNQQHAGFYLFSGHQTNTKPFDFDMATGITTYKGNNGKAQREVGPGVVLTANVSGAELIQGGDLFQTAWQLARDLRAGDTAAVGASLDQIDNVRDNIITLRAIVGVRSHRLEQAKTQAIDARVNLTVLLEQAQGVDFERAILEMQQAEISYRTALQVGARIIPPSLVDFLR